MASIKDGNNLFSNQGLNPLVNFNFMLRVELAFDLPCRRIHAFTRELEYDYIQEGGLNDYVHMRRKPITKPFTLEVERYVGVDYTDPLKLGTELMLPMLLFVSRKQDDFGHPYRTYVFTGCSVIKKTFGELVSEQSGLLVETTTIAYREMLCVDTPWNEEDIPTAGATNAPGNSDSERKKEEDGQNLKAAAMDYYLRARQADAAMEYSPEAAAAFKTELEEGVTKLKDALKGSGTLAKALDSAKRGMESQGSPLKEIARDARGEANSKAREMRRVEPPFRKAEEAWKKADDKATAAQEAVQEAKSALAALQQEQTQTRERLEALETELEQADELEASAQAGLEEAKQALSTMQAEDEAENADLTQQLKEARTQLEEREQLEVDTQTRLEEAKQKLADTQAEAESKAEDEDKAELDQQLEEARSQLEKLEDELNKRKTETKAAQERVEGFEEDLRRAGERQTRRISEGEDRIKAAEKACQDSIQSRNDLEKEQATLEERAEALETELETVQTAIESAEESEEEAKAALEEAEEALKEPKATYEKAEKAFTQADAAAKEKELEAARAAAALAQAQDRFDRGRRSLQSLQNSLNNLPSRMETAEKAQKECHKQFALCEEENDQVQNLPDEPVPPINQGYEAVKKYAKETLFQQRIVQATEQHIETARTLLEQLPPMEEEEEAGAV